MEQAYELNETSFKRNIVDFKRRRIPTSQWWTIFITGFCRSLHLDCDAAMVAKITPEKVRAPGGRVRNISGVLEPSIQFSRYAQQTTTPE